MRLSASIIVAAFFAGCGYGFVAGHAPFGAAQIAVVPFDERQPAGIAGDVGSHLAQLLASGGVELRLDRSAADAQLIGSIDSVRTVPSVTASAVGAYEVYVASSAQLVGRDGKVLWRGAANAREDFLPAASGGLDGPLANEANRRRALSRLAEKLARSLHEQLVLASHAADEKRAVRPMPKTSPPTPAPTPAAPTPGATPAAAQGT